MDDGQPVQCDIPVISGLKTFVACAKGKDENTILGGWVPKMRKAGSMVVMTQLSDMTSLTKDPGGVFDLVVVEDGEDVDADNLNEVRCFMFSNLTLPNKIFSCCTEERWFSCVCEIVNTGRSGLWRLVRSCEL